MNLIAPAAIDPGHAHPADRRGPRRRDRRPRRRPGPHPPGVDAHDHHPRRPRHLRPHPPRADRHPGRATRSKRRSRPPASTWSTPSSAATGRWPTSSTPTPSPSPAATPAAAPRAHPRCPLVDRPRRRASASSGDATVGATSDLALTFTHVDAAGQNTGPVTDLQPYLGAAGHVVRDARRRLHVRPPPRRDVRQRRPARTGPARHPVRPRPGPARPVRPARRLPPLGAVPSSPTAPSSPPPSSSTPTCPPAPRRRRHRPPPLTDRPQSRHRTGDTP